MDSPLSELHALLNHQETDRDCITEISNKISAIEADPSAIQQYLAIIKNSHDLTMAKAATSGFRRVLLIHGEIISQDAQFAAAILDSALGIISTGQMEELLRLFITSLAPLIEVMGEQWIELIHVESRMPAIVKYAVYFLELNNLVVTRGVVTLIYQLADTVPDGLRPYVENLARKLLELAQSASDELNEMSLEAIQAFMDNVTLDSSFVLEAIPALCSIYEPSSTRSGSSILRAIAGALRCLDEGMPLTSLMTSSNLCTMLSAGTRAMRKVCSRAR
jgi:hypothetical protein